MVCASSFNFYDGIGVVGSESLVFGSVGCNTFDELVFVPVIMASAFLVCIVKRGHIF